MKDKALGAHFLLTLFFCNFNLKTRLKVKSCPIFDETAKLCRALEDAYTSGLSSLAHPDFGRSVNPISNGEDRLCPPNYYWHTQIFRPSDVPVALS